MTILAAIPKIAEVMASVTGIEAAPSYPTETRSEQLFAIVYPQRGEVNVGPIGTRKGLDSISIDVLKLRTTLEVDMEILLPLWEAVPFALINEISYNGDRFTNTIQTFEKVVREFMPLYEYDKVRCIGYRFTMENVKCLVNE